MMKSIDERIVPIVATVVVAGIGAVGSYILAPALGVDNVLAAALSGLTIGAVVGGAFGARLRRQGLEQASSGDRIASSELGAPDLGSPGAHILSDTGPPDAIIADDEDASLLAWLADDDMPVDAGGASASEARTEQEPPDQSRGGSSVFADLPEVAAARGARASWGTVDAVLGAFGDSSTASPEPGSDPGCPDSPGGGRVISRIALQSPFGDGSKPPMVPSEVRVSISDELSDGDALAAAFEADLDRAEPAPGSISDEESATDLPAPSSRSLSATDRSRARAFDDARFGSSQPASNRTINGGLAADPLPSRIDPAIAESGGASAALGGAFPEERDEPTLDVPAADDLARDVDAVAQSYESLDVAPFPAMDGGVEVAGGPADGSRRIDGDAGLPPRKVASFDFDGRSTGEDAGVGEQMVTRRLDEAAVVKRPRRRLRRDEEPGDRAELAMRASRMTARLSTSGPAVETSRVATARLSADDRDGINEQALRGLFREYNAAARRGGRQDELMPFGPFASMVRAAWAEARRSHGSTALVAHVEIHKDEPRVVIGRLDGSGTSSQPRKDAQLASGS